METVFLFKKLRQVTASLSNIKQKTLLPAYKKHRTFAPKE